MRLPRIPYLSAIASEGAPAAVEAGRDGQTVGVDAPSIGLALGGGAARGWAHIGVIRALIETGIRPDVIAGTSIGAVVGGAYAAGKLDALEAWARSLTRRRVFGLLDFRIDGAGLIGGGRLYDLLAKEFGESLIEDLAQRVVIVATELGTGHEIWFTRGSLTQAMRASYALPGVFAPARVGERWLVDGALVNPVPVSAARALGARVVIAVHLHSDVSGRGAVIRLEDHDGLAVTAPAEALDAAPAGFLRSARQMISRQMATARDKDAPGIPSVMMDAFNIIQDRLTRSRLAGDPPDVLVAPRLARIGLFDFHRAEETIALGHEAARRALDELFETLESLA